jgi:hypothetical protein
MAADRSYIEPNRAELQRLRDLLGRLTDEQLVHPMDAGWTPASYLLHMAFWDQRVAVMLEAWGPDGTGPAPIYDDPGVDWINDTTKPIFLGVPPRVAANLSLAAAEASDAAVAAMSDDLLAKDEETGWIINPLRAEHRREHLDELEHLFPPS